MMEYAARVCPDGRIQTVKAHTEGVCMKARTDSELLMTSSIVRLACLLHDMGKNTAYSNSYQNTVGLGNDWHENKPIHSHAGAKLIYERYYNESRSDFPYSALLSELLETVIMSHHGLFDCLKIASEKGNFNGLLKKIRNDDYDFEEACELLFAQIISPEKADALFDSAVEEMKNLIEKIGKTAERKDEFIFYISMTFRMILSVLVNADHSDAAEFASKEITDCSYGDSRLWQKCVDYLDDKLSAFEIKTPLQYARNEISRKLLEKSAEKQGIVRLSVTTGGGKTLSSLRYAIHYAKRFEKSRIIYVAPFNSILEQNSAEYRRFLPDDVGLLEHFGDIVTYENNPSALRFYTENWGSPFIATSMVQFLNTMFLGKISSVRRMRGLINSVIIIDEVQSVPVQCISLFNLAINFLAEICRCTVVLCSATQPTLEEGMKHKIRLSGGGELLVNRSAYDKCFKRTKVIDSRKPGGYTFEDTAGFVLKIAENSKSVLLIVNTKEASRTVCSMIKNRISEKGMEDSYYVVHLSTNMCPAHRKTEMSKLRERLRGDLKVICVSTQLIEAGVDISFESVVRSLAGLDNIIQSAGRCNRNKETDLGVVHVINITEENISRIKAIKTGAEITQRLMETMRKTPALFNGDITCEEAVSRYYRDYFSEFKNELDYNVSIDNMNTTIFKLLSDNSDAINWAEAYRDGERNLFFDQSFETAGECFRVIEDYTNSVVVPYGEGKELINTLCSGQLSVCPADLLRRLQKYSIGLSDAQCENRVVKNPQTGILILKDGFYNSEYGFDPDGNPDTLLF